jgi:hypothetical protein
MSRVQPRFWICIDSRYSTVEAVRLVEGMFQLEETCRIIPTVETEIIRDFADFADFFPSEFFSLKKRNLRNLRIIVLSSSRICPIFL